jgi:predicted glycoside hydrolase/deacetylase ChbG (UPF0249 family)
MIDNIGGILQCRLVLADPMANHPDVLTEERTMAIYVSVALGCRSHREDHFGLGRKPALLPALYSDLLNMSYVIINADDFGYSDGICRSILELWEAGAISGTSLMCAANDAKQRMLRFDVRRLLGFAGVHLQLTGGKPLSSREEVPSLYDGDHKFRDPRTGDHPNLREVELEWRRQFELAAEVLGGTPTHLDSHHGVHRLPSVFELYVKLAREWKIPVRGSSDENLQSKMRAAGVAGSAVLVREWTGRSLGGQALRDLVRNAIAKHPDERAVEVISHPGFNDTYLSSVSSLAQAREDDHRALLELRKLGWPSIDGSTLAPHSCLIEPR